MNPYVGEKNSAIFAKFRICLAWMLHGAVGGAFGDATNQELSEAFPRTSPPGPETVWTANRRRRSDWIVCQIFITFPGMHGF
jgi:hypothetical protein